MHRLVTAQTALDVSHVDRSLVAAVLDCCRLVSTTSLQACLGQANRLPYIVLIGTADSALDVSHVSLNPNTSMWTGCLFLLSLIGFVSCPEEESGQ